jgi:hypothetical protein
VVEVAEGNIAQTDKGRDERLSGVQEHGMWSKLVHKRGRSQAAPRKKGYRLTSVKARRSRELHGKSDGS